MLESGAVYRNLPPHALAFSNEPEPVWTVKHAQAWDCYSWDFATHEYDYLRGLDCKLRTAGGEVEGQYLFTASPVGDGYSAEPAEAKEFVFAATDNGRLSIQPTDRVIFRDKSFTREPFSFPKGLKRQTEVWSVE
jgi:hypothetical protein